MRSPTARQSMVAFSWRAMFGLASALLCALALASCASGGSGAGARGSGSIPRGSPTSLGSATSSTTSPAAGGTSSTTTAPSRPITRPLRTNPAGALPQTAAEPAAASAQFHQEMADLFAGIRSGSLRQAIWSFFPEKAYDRLKAIEDADGDWHARLVRDFELDIAAVHRYLYSSKGAASARLLSVRVDPAVAWIPPGYCYNSIGYWPAPGARLVYRQDGEERSIGIASLISWRGQWYVVHLGAVLRDTDVGIVDDPAAGSGTFGPPGGC